MNLSKRRRTAKVRQSGTVGGCQMAVVRFWRGQMTFCQFEWGYRPLSDFEEVMRSVVQWGYMAIVRCEEDCQVRAESGGICSLGSLKSSKAIENMTEVAKSRLFAIFPFTFCRQLLVLRKHSNGPLLFCAVVALTQKLWRSTLTIRKELLTEPNTYLWANNYDIS